MSAFEVTITPTRSRNKRSESLQPTIVCMAPFSAKSIVQFEDVPLTKTAKRILRIMNPSDEDIEVKITKPIRPEHNITTTWTEKFISSQSEVEMELIWIPQMDIACKETLQLTDNRNFRKDVMIILKTRSIKSVKHTHKFPTISSTVNSTHVRTMRLKSPTNGIKQKRILHQQKHRQDKQKVETRTTTLVKNPTKAKSKGDMPKTNWQGTSQVSPLSESNLNVANSHMVSNNLNVSPLLSNCGDMPKENINPTTPTSIMSLIDNLNFTPATKTTEKGRFYGESLACLPTPSNTTFETPNVNIDVRQLRPRKLTAFEFCDGPTEVSSSSTIPQVLVEGCEATTSNFANNSGVATDKTFEVKRTEEFDLSHDILDASAVVMNRTTTIQHTPMSRTLTMIREEEDISSVMEATNIKDIQNYDLKRDIKLVGTPLRKYSESMKDLSWKSPQTKLPIQGSMPNLNEMETIRSIEQNRYFYQNCQSQNHIEKSVDVVPVSNKRQESILNGNEKSLCSAAILSPCSLNITTQADLNFNQSEILAQSSRFNLNEVGVANSKKRGSPMSMCEKKSSNILCGTIPKPDAVKKISPNERKDKSFKTLQPGQKRCLHELSFSDTQSTESLAQAEVNNTKYSNKLNHSISPPKRQRFDISGDHSFLRPASVHSPTSRKDWSRVQPKKIARLTKTLSLIKRPITPNKTKQEQPIKLYDSGLYLQTHINPDPFAATTVCDPFLASTMYLDERAIEIHQTDFRKWLNALVSIPEDLDADSNTKIDVGKLFNEVRNKELTLAPTKEEQSMNYLTKFRLESLRHAAVKLFFSDEMRMPCTKVAVYIQKQALRIRNDRNLHLDVVMQRNILELLLCFNPLWLRLGLEVVYGEKIHLHSNRDVVLLSTFILNRLFRDKFVEQKYSKAYTLSEEYAEYIKKFTLQKILFLLLFLDKAKSKRIIKHNPCLFVKKSQYKETKDILLRFSSELLANVGDITRDLKRLGYVLQHKQSYLDEFDYAFNNLAVDLRDGVRLTRVMEIILLREGLTQQLRVPAISRLQRIFNVNLALRALSEADFQLNGDITAADIVDGHREKTLSLLWQIIYKFRSPKFHAAAKTIQMWWRRNWLRVVIRRRLKQKEMHRREVAATKIQALFRGFLTRRFVIAYREECTQAAIVLQKYIRRYLVQKHLLEENNAAIVIQHYYRSHLLRRHCREEFLRLRASTIFIQRIYRRRLLSRKLLILAEKAKRQREQKRQAAAAFIQSYWRAFCETRLIRAQYLQFRQHVILVQQRFRARKHMERERTYYERLRQVTNFVQQQFRAKIQMRQQRQIYLHTLEVVIKLQQRWRAQLKMREDRNRFLNQRQIIIKLQQRIRATFAMRKKREMYQQKCCAVKVIQQRYRAHVAMKTQLNRYQQIRKSIIFIQQKWRATMLARRIRVGFIEQQYYATVLQQKYRAKRQMRLERASFLKLRDATLVLQRYYRAKRQMVHERLQYQKKQQASIKLQRYFRAYKRMRFERAKYQGVRTAVICLQQHIRGYLLMKRERTGFLKLKEATICLQRAWRAKCDMRRDRACYEQLRSAAITIQLRFRGKLDMRKKMLEYKNQRELVISIQRRWRGKLLMRKIRQEYHEKLAAIIKIQQCYRALRQMHTERLKYVEIRAKIIHIQQFYRSFKCMQNERKQFLKKRSAASCIQNWYRSVKEMQRQKDNYEQLRKSIVTIQRKWRATLAAREQRNIYIETRNKIVFIQRKYRSTQLKRKAQVEFQQIKAAAIVLQRRYRARLEMLKIRSQYLLIVSLVLCIQRKFRANREMFKQRHDYRLLRYWTVHLQQKFRGKHLMQKERAHFELLRKSVLEFQAHARGILARRRFQQLLTPEMMELRRRKRAAKVIQRFYRGYRVRKRLRSVALQQIRQNIDALKSTSTAVNSLRYKLMDSVRILRGRFSVSEVLHVLQRLERLSRTVPHLILSHSEFISSFCYGIMAQAIRSEIDKQMIELCSRIILNLARVSSDSFQQNGLVTIAQMLLRWCDKDCEIFNTLCTLIWIFSHCPEKRKIIREFMTTPEAIYMLRETKKLVTRKEKMKLKDRRLLSIGPQNRQFSNRALPSLEPDYGIIHKRPYTFISSVYAFDTALCKLGIDVY